jgi:membrane-associated phospholipid phosphatase
VKYLTDFADQAVMLPVVFAVGVTLWWQGWRRGALLWLGVVGATFAAVLCSKLVFLGCSPVFSPLDLYTPSGHVAAATVVGGGLAVLLTGRLRSAMPAALLAAIVIGISRLVLRDHTVPEVLVGGLIGMTGAAALMHFTGPPPRLRVKPLIAVIFVTAVIFHGLRLPAEAAIRHTAFSIARFIPACRAAPYVWHERVVRDPF